VVSRSFGGTGGKRRRYTAKQKKKVGARLLEEIHPGPVGDKREKKKRKVRLLEQVKKKSDHLFRKGGGEFLPNLEGGGNRLLRGGTKFKDSEK